MEKARPTVVEEVEHTAAAPAVVGDSSTDEESYYSSDGESYYTSDSDYESDGSDKHHSISDTAQSSSDDEQLVRLPRRPTTTAEELTPLEARDIIARTFAEMLQCRKIRKSRIEAYMYVL